MSLYRKEPDYICKSCGKTTEGHVWIPGLTLPPSTPTCMHCNDVQIKKVNEAILDLNERFTIEYQEVIRKLEKL